MENKSNEVESTHARTTKSIKKSSKKVSDKALKSTVTVNTARAKKAADNKLKQEEFINIIEEQSKGVVTLNDFLEYGMTVPKIIGEFSYNLRKVALEEKDEVDVKMSSFFLAYNQLLLDSRSITRQSDALYKFYYGIVQAYPEYAFSFSGRLKSLYRAYLKYNRYIMNFIKKVYDEKGTFPTAEEINADLQGRYRDICGYRLIVNIPICHIDTDLSLAKRKEVKVKKELELIYDIANRLPSFLEANNFDPLPASTLSDVAAEKHAEALESSPLKDDAKRFFKDYIASPNSRGYQAIHIAAHDVLANSNLEIQIASWDMDSHNQLISNHDLYELEQKTRLHESVNMDLLKCPYYKKAFVRTSKAYLIDFTKVYIDMFTALSKSKINDKSGFLFSREIAPYEHLSKDQILAQQIHF